MFSHLCIALGLWIMIITVASQGNIGDLGNLLGAFSQLVGDLAEDCSYKCPEGKEAIPRPGHRPSSNGCGSQGISLKTASYPGMTRCCDLHDICYDQCGSKRKQCDESLRQCLTEYCQQQSEGKGSQWLEECKGTSNLISGGAAGFGCQAFLDSQAKACECRQKSSKQRTKTTSNSDL